MAQELPEHFQDHMKLLLELQETTKELVQVREQYHAATETIRVLTRTTAHSLF